MIQKKSQKVLRKHQKQFTRKQREDQEKKFLRRIRLAAMFCQDKMGKSVHNEMKPANL